MTDEPSTTNSPAEDAAETVAQETGQYQPPSFRNDSQDDNRSLLFLLRLLFMVLLVTVSVLTVASEANSPEDFNLLTLGTLFLAAVTIGAVVLILDARTPNKRLGSVVGIYLGICLGLLGALAIGALVDVVAEAWDLTGGRLSLYLGLAKVMIAIVLCYFAASVVITTKDDFRLVIPYVEFSKQVRGVRPLLLDTSALIDGRIDALGQTGLLDAPLVLPRFVIDELQALSDSADKLKRARGRRGLDMVTKLQQNFMIDLSIDDTDAAGGSVDHKLIEVAREQRMRILTTDYNLNKVADIQDVPALNLNSISHALKAQVTPGDSLMVEVIKVGESPDQGVGYLPDGTMVVVDGAADFVGKEIHLVVTNSLQTTAGRMIFGRVQGEISEGGSEDDSDAEERASNLAEAATNQPRATERPPREAKPRRTSHRNPRR